MTDDEDDALGVEEIAGGTYSAYGTLDPARPSGEATLKTRALRYDDEPGHVTLTMSLADTQLRVSLDAADARAVADELDRLAAEAECEPDAAPPAPEGRHAE